MSVTAWVAVLGLTLTFLGNIAAAVWFFSKLNQLVNMVRADVARLERSFESLCLRFDRLSDRLMVIDRDVAVLNATIREPRGGEPKQ